MMFYLTAVIVQAPKTAAPAAKKAVKAAKPAKTQSPLFVSAPKSARVGGDIRVMLCFAYASD